MYNDRALTTGDTPMARPRMAEGRPLPENMYLMPGHKSLPLDQQRFRYKLPNGKFSGLRDSSKQLASYEQAVPIANAANKLRDNVQTTSTPTLTSLTYWRSRYIEWAEEQNPKLASKSSWRQRCSEMKLFAENFTLLRTNRLTLSDIEPWWDALTYDQQHNRRAAHSKWFLWMLNRSAVKENPFANTQDRPCLINKPKPDKSRLQLELHQFWAIYNSAGKLGLDYVQIGMGVALVTMMRESDICDLRLDTHITDNHLKKTINKSLGQRGSTGASHLDFDLNKHILLKGLINRARELSLRHQRCPYVLSYKPKQKRLGKTKDHTHQVTPRMLIAGFAEARDATKIWADIPEGRTPPTFHEIKGDSINEAKKHAVSKGYSKADISDQAAHADGRVTDGYNANHEPIWQPANVIFDEEMINGNF